MRNPKALLAIRYPLLAFLRIPATRNENRPKVLHSPCPPPVFFRWGSGWKNSDHQARRAVICKEPSFLSSAGRGQRGNHFRRKLSKTISPFEFPWDRPGPRDDEPPQDDDPNFFSLNPMGSTLLFPDSCRQRGFLFKNWGWARARFPLT